MGAVPQNDGWDSSFDRVDGEGRGKERPAHSLSPRQREYIAHIKQLRAAEEASRLAKQADGDADKLQP